MNQAKFEHWLDTWLRRMPLGFAASFDALEIHFADMSESQRDQASIHLRCLPYELFLATPYWHAIRLRLFARREGRCETCKCDLYLEYFEVHHTTYDHHGSEHAHLADLKVLCATCHAIITEAVRTMKAQLQSANAVKPEPAEDRPEERQQQRRES